MFAKFTTKRFVFSAVGLVLSTAMVFTGKMTDSVWVYSLAVILSAHHAEDLVKAFKADKAS